MIMTFKQKHIAFIVAHVRRISKLSSIVTWSSALFHAVFHERKNRFYCYICREFNSSRRNSSEKMQSILSRTNVMCDQIQWEAEAMCICANWVDQFVVHWNENFRGEQVF